MKPGSQLNLKADSFLVLTRGKLDPHMEDLVLIKAVREVSDLNVELIARGISQTPDRYDKLIS
jgi:hypothetical protein